MTKRLQGFTIVELLIVVVVIAILAAITIVAYNGIQQRAKNTQVIAGVSAYMKALAQYNVDKGSYPPQNNSCLGSGYPDNQCWAGVSGTWSVNTGFDALLAEYLPSKPQLANSLIAIGINDNRRAGALYITGPSRVVFYLHGVNQNCIIAGAVGVNEGGVVTQCVATLQ